MPQTAELWNEYGPKVVTLRQLTEKQEILALEEHFYAHMPAVCADFFRNGVMLEDVDDMDKKRFYKAADYFSADFEVWWNIKAGSRESRFREILCESCAPKSNRTPVERELLEMFVERCKNVVFLD